MSRTLAADNILGVGDIFSILKSNKHFAGPKKQTLKCRRSPKCSNKQAVCFSRRQ
jgi:hypothetical protein